MQHASLSKACIKGDDVALDEAANCRVNKMSAKALLSQRVFISPGRPQRINSVLTMRQTPLRFFSLLMT